MKIIILGAGRVGESAADNLIGEKNDITVIDTDASRLRELESRFDLRGVVGDGIDPAVLAEAGARDADMLIACAPQDDTNLVCCKLAKLLFNVPTRIARVRNAALRSQAELLSDEGFAVSRAFCPEESLMNYIGKLVEHPEALQVREFALGHACLVSVRARGGAPVVGLSISDARQGVPDIPMRVVGIYRRFQHEADRFVPCENSTRIEPGDEVFILAARKQVDQVLAAFHRQVGERERPVRRIMIAGGGRVGFRLAKHLSGMGDFQIKIIEKNEDRCVYLASQLPSNVLVLRGDATDEHLIEGESIEDVDMFLSLTSDDEDNIMASLLAKKLGASRVLALINRRSYAELMHGTQIDIALAPAQAVLGELLAYVRQGDVQAVHSLRRGVAEALEIVVRGDARTSKVVGRRVGGLRLPHQVHVGLIVRGLPAPDSRSTNGSGSDDEEAQDDKAPPVVPEVIVPTSGTVLQPGDHVILFLPNKRLVHQVESLFSVGATFF